MGTSTDGQICFGVMFEEDYEFPWSQDDDSEIEEWWRKENNYEPPFEAWTEEGERIDGITDAQVSEYFAHQREWEKNNPIPIVEVNYCSGEYPMIILAAPSSQMSARRGYPIEFDPKDLLVDEQEEQALKDFCAKYDLENTGAKWWLSSYWG